MRLDALPCVHKSALYIYNFTSLCSEFLWMSFYMCQFFQLLFSNTCENVSNRVGWPHEFHGLPPILCDAVTIFVYTDQFFCCCAFIYSNFHGKLLFRLLYFMVANDIVSAITWVIWNNKFISLAQWKHAFEDVEDTNTGTKCMSSANSRWFTTMLSTVYHLLVVCDWTESSSRYVANKIHCIVKFLYVMNVFLNQKLSHVLWKNWNFYIYIYKHLGCFHYS